MTVFDVSLPFTPSPASVNLLCSLYWILPNLFSLHLRLLADWSTFACSLAVQNVHIHLMFLTSALLVDFYRMIPFVFQIHGIFKTHIWYLLQGFLSLSIESISCSVIYSYIYIKGPHLRMERTWEGYDPSGTNRCPGWRNVWIAKHQVFYHQHIARAFFWKTLRPWLPDSIWACQFFCESEGFDHGVSFFFFCNWQVILWI